MLSQFYWWEKMIITRHLFTKRVERNEYKIKMSACKKVFFFYSVNTNKTGGSQPSIYWTPVTDLHKPFLFFLKNLFVKLIKISLGGKCGRMWTYSMNLNRSELHLLCAVEMVSHSLGPPQVKAFTNAQPTLKHTHSCPADKY